MTFPEEFKNRVKKAFPASEEMSQRLENGDEIYVAAQLYLSLSDARTAKLSPSVLSDPVTQYFIKQAENSRRFYSQRFKIVKATASYEELEELYDEYLAIKDAERKAELEACRPGKQQS